MHAIVILQRSLAIDVSAFIPETMTLKDFEFDDKLIIQVNPYGPLWSDLDKCAPKVDACLG